MNGSSSSNSARLPPMEIFSYSGTSQYTAGGPSACGLASVNAALLVLSLCSSASTTQEALDTIRSQEFVEKIMEICSLWTHEGHLDVDDVLALPMFDTTLGTLAIEGNWCSPENFRKLYGLLRDDTYTVAIITRPPEIVALFNIPSGDPEIPNIPILFDSHPRPHLHPKGAAFISFLNEEGAIEYLSSLFQTDKALLESRTWDASLLGQYTAHILKLGVSTQAENERAFYQANIRILMEQASLREATTREEALGAEVASLRGQMALQQQRIDRAMAEETAARDELQFLRHEVDQLKRSATHEKWSRPWTEVVSWTSGTPPRRPSVTPRDQGLVFSMENGYAGHSASRQRADSAQGHSASSSISTLWPFHGKRATGESTKANPSEEALAYERARQQSAREETLRLRGKAKNVSTGESTKANLSEEALAYERARQQNAREETLRLKGKAKNVSTGSTYLLSEPPAYTPTEPSPPPSTTTIDDAANARALQAQLDNERASYELARRLQAQEDAAIQEHRRLVQEESRVKLFHCDICIEEYRMDFSAPIASCGHVTCRACMKEHVQSQVGQFIWPIRCPMCVADHTRTEEQGVITRDLIETLGINEAVLDKWVKMEMEKVSVVVECPSCRKTAPVDATDFRQATEMNCPLGCGAHWCKQCNRTFTRGGIHSCDGQAEMDHLLGQKDWKKCPACHVPVEKIQGCNHMTCRCHCHFCYICGGEITRSTNKRDIDQELQNHYRRSCKLFEYEHS